MDIILEHNCCILIFFLRKNLYHLNINSMSVNKRLSYITPSHQKYTGAGVLLIEQVYTKGRKPQQSAIILGLNTFTGMYEDFGGFIDIGDHVRRDTISAAASRETYEETNGYLIIPASTLAARPLHVNVRQYRVYVVCIPTGYFLNRNALAFLNEQHQERELDGYTRVYLSDLFRSGVLHKPGDLETVDAMGNRITIKGRTKAAFREAYHKGIVRDSLYHPKKVVKKVSKALLIK